MLEGLIRKGDKLEKQIEELQFLLLNFKVEKKLSYKKIIIEQIKEMRLTINQILMEVKDCYIKE